MKRMIVLLLSLSLLVGCVPTPEEEVVLNKTEGRLEAAIAETTPVPAYQTEQVELQTSGTETEAPAISTIRTYTIWRASPTPFGRKTPSPQPKNLSQSSRSKA